MKQIIIILLLSFSITLTAQNGLEIGMNYKPTLSTFHDSKVSSDVKEYRFFNSYGIFIQKNWNNKLFIRTGIDLLTQGTIYLYEDEFGFSDEKGYYTLQSINLPIQLGYNFINKDKVRLGLSTGLSVGLFTRKEYKDDLLSMDNILTFGDYYFGIPTNLVSSFKVTDNLWLNFSPTMNIQLDAEEGRTGNKSRIISYTFDVGLSYQF